MLSFSALFLSPHQLMLVMKTGNSHNGILTPKKKNLFCYYIKMFVKERMNGKAFSMHNGR